MAAFAAAVVRGARADILLAAPEARRIYRNCWKLRNCSLRLEISIMHHL